MSICRVPEGLCTHRNGRSSLLVILFATPASGADQKIIVPPGTKPGGNYSQGILIRTARCMFLVRAARTRPARFLAISTPQVKQSLNNIETVLKAAGMAPADVVSICRWDLTDASKFQQMNAVYTGYFKEPRPTRTTVVVAKLVGSGNIEITRSRPESNASAARRLIRRRGKTESLAGPFDLRYPGSATNVGWAMTWCAPDRAVECPGHFSGCPKTCEAIRARLESVLGARRPAGACATDPLAPLSTPFPHDETTRPRRRTDDRAHDRRRAWRCQRCAQPIRKPVRHSLSRCGATKTTKILSGSNACVTTEVDRE